jgi:hypothetical protein
MVEYPYRERWGRERWWLPARLTVEQVAEELQCTIEGVYVLTKMRQLRPLGNPPPNGTKYYAREYILRLAKDEAWLARASDALVKYKWAKNHPAKAA